MIVPSENIVSNAAVVFPPKDLILIPESLFDNDQSVINSRNVSTVLGKQTIYIHSIDAIYALLITVIAQRDSASTRYPSIQIRLQQNAFIESINNEHKSFMSETYYNTIS